MRRSKMNRTIGDLVPAFYSLAIASTVLGKIMVPMLKEDAKEDRKISKLLKRRGLVIVKIIDKGDWETTYQEIKDIEKNLDLFVKLNKNKWKLEKENTYGIKTGRYILTRIYRRYTKPYKEPKVCKECGRSLDDDY